MLMGQEQSAIPIDKKSALVYEVPITGEISTAQLFILRRALKNAIENNIDIIVLKLDTPGGALDVMLQMMEALDNFKGRTIAYVNDEAISAGAYIAIVTDKIYFAPDGVMGAAAAVLSTGQDVGETMKLKINSYLSAKVRAFTKENPYRADVQKAMMDEDYVLTMDGVILKNKGELLTLTADEAVKAYGMPPRPLLASGIVKDIHQLLVLELDGAPYTLDTFEITWSESFAKWLKGLSPVLLGLGMLFIFMELNTPGFGLTGLLGLVFLATVFAANYVAGIAGHEEIIIFILGFILLAVEVLVIPGTTIVGALGLLLMLGSLTWAMADVWPNADFEWTWAMWTEPLLNIFLGFCIFVVGAILLVRYAPKTWLWNKLLLRASAAPKNTSMAKGQSKPNLRHLIGQEGITVTDLVPSGEVEIANKRYEAKTLVGFIPSGQIVRVIDVSDFALMVKKIN